MLKQKKENHMFNKLTGSHFSNIKIMAIQVLFTLLLAIMFSACSVTPEISVSGGDNETSSANNEVLADAISAMKSGENKEARSLLLAIINENPNFVHAHINLAIVFIKMKSYDEAENSLNRALKIDPNNIYALNQVGFLYRQQGEFSKAKTSYLKAIDINDDYAYAHLNLGILYDLYLYDFENAIEQYKIYNDLTKESDKQVSKWIFDLERRLKKSLAQK